MPTAEMMQNTQRDAAARSEVTVEEIRDFFCCPYIWWLRDTPLSLEHREQLARLKQEPGAGRSRTMPFEVPGTGLLWLFSIACAVAALIAWSISWLLRHESLYLIVYSLNLIGTVVMGFSIYFIVRWYCWRQRTPDYLRAIPGDVLSRDDVERDRKLVRASRYGIAGHLNCVVRQGRNLATLETRSLVTPKRLTVQDRMQAVAQALLAEAEFGVRPGYAYVVYPDRTFEVRIGRYEVEQLLAAVRTMRRSRETGQPPEAKPAWHLCPACPLVSCPGRIAAAPGQTA